MYLLWTNTPQSLHLKNKKSKNRLGVADLYLWVHVRLGEVEETSPIHFITKCISNKV